MLWRWMEEDGLCEVESELKCSTLGLSWEGTYFTLQLIFGGRGQMTEGKTLDPLMVGNKNVLGLVLWGNFPSSYSMQTVDKLWWNVIYN